MAHIDTEIPVMQLPEGLRIGYTLSGGRERQVACLPELQLLAGELVCLIGPNGAGKSTLLRTMAGLQPPLAGSPLLGGRPLSRLSARERAMGVAVVLTERLSAPDLRVRELVALGRAPYTGWGGGLQPEDEQAVDRALEQVQAQELAARKLHALSDGEYQRVMIARALAQDTPLLLLDEPTAHLDVLHRMEVLRLLRRIARQSGKAVVLSTHELQLALQAADLLWLQLPEGRVVSGSADRLVAEGWLERHFTAPGIRFLPQQGSFQLHAPAASQPLGLRIAREVADRHALRLQWLSDTLQREGFCLQPEQGQPLLVEIGEDAQGQLQVFLSQGTERQGCEGDSLSLMRLLRKKILP